MLHFLRRLDGVLSTIAFVGACRTPRLMGKPSSLSLFVLAFDRVRLLTRSAGFRTKTWRDTCLLGLDGSCPRSSLSSNELAKEDVGPYASETDDGAALLLEGFRDRIHDLVRLGCVRNADDFLVLDSSSISSSSPLSSSSEDEMKSAEGDKVAESATSLQVLLDERVSEL